MMSSDFTESEEATRHPLLDGLHQYFGFSEFRKGQAEIIASVMDGRNTVAVMPTGAGKSLCYQLPATLLPKTTLVVSPLIALMQDQVEHLRSHQISAGALHSGLSEAQTTELISRLQAGRLKLLYVAPERLRSERLLQLLEGRLELLAVDEAHCISAWGHDFRPDYGLLGQVRRRLRPPKTMALTATATPEVRDDIVRVLRLKEPRVFVSGFDRPNLSLETIQVAGDDDKARTCLDLARQHGSGLIYCATRKSAISLHKSLTGGNVDAILYHAGMGDDERQQALERFMSTPQTVAVATNAFGMGIDKPNIRFVAHAAIPRSVEAYYQEIGRAGRDGLNAHAILLFNHSDVFVQQRMIQGTYPPETLLADVWNYLIRQPKHEQSTSTLARHIGANEFEVGAAIRIMERGGFLSRGGRGDGAWTFTLAPEAAAFRSSSGHANAVLNSLRQHSSASTELAVSLQTLETQSGLSGSRLRHVLAQLEKAKLLSIQKPYAGKAIRMKSQATFDQLGIDVARIRAQERQALRLLRRMTDYAYTRHCRRGFLLRYFGEQPPTVRCLACDICTGTQTRPTFKKPTQSNGQLELTYSALAFEELQRWRRMLSGNLKMPAYLIFSDKTLKAFAAVLPTSREEFLTIKGTGPTRWERFGLKVTSVSAMARAAGEIPRHTESVLKKRTSAPRRMVAKRTPPAPSMMELHG